MVRGGAAPAHATTSVVPAETVEDWAKSAAAGDEFVYHTGSHLLPSLPALAIVRRLQADGSVTLYQRRLGPSKFAYCVQLRRRPERRPLSARRVDTSGLTNDLRELMRALEELANTGAECPSNGQLADQLGFAGRAATRYRLISLMRCGYIDMAETAAGRRVITIRATGARTMGPAA